MLLTARRIKDAFDVMRFERGLPEESRRVLAADRRNLQNGGATPDIEASIAAALDWIGRAQDRSATQDGGVARHFSLIDGWSPSYPETTGYIIPTLIEQADRLGRPEFKDRARRMLDWLVALQFPEGGLPGGMITQEPQVPVTFNTGQILFGFVAGRIAFGEAYEAPMRKAADWLVETQDSDGKWSKHPTPFAAHSLKTYETHVAWALMEAARVQPDAPWGAAALAQVDWALSHMRENGWLELCCLGRPHEPLTHTLGYALRGVVEAWRFSGEEKYRAHALRMARGIAGVVETDGRLPGRLDEHWRPTVDWVCLTGTVQIAHSFLLLAAPGDAPELAERAIRMNAYVRRTMALDGPDGVRGGVKGSHPANGGYGTYQYLNWAPKFMIDSLTAELSA